MAKFRPMLAATLENLTTLKFPVLVSDKEDGIRCVLRESVINAGKRMAYSRTLKPIPNLHIRNTLTQSSIPLGLDGELISGQNFQETTSAVMTGAERPEFEYRVFDYFGVSYRTPFAARYEALRILTEQFRAVYPWLHLVPHTLVNNLAELNLYEEQAVIIRKKEGVMIRSVDGQYKFGRSTLREGWLLKLKRFTETEARVVGFTELMRNENEQVSDNLGYADRSSAQDNLVPGNTLGALICRDCNSHIQFNIGTGFTAKQRYEIWVNQDKYLGQVVTYKYQNFGIKNAPRAPVFLRWRPDYNL